MLLRQTRETMVHRFVVEASVEENVHRLCAARAAAMDLSAAGVSKRSKNEEKMLSVRCASLGTARLFGRSSSIDFCSASRCKFCPICSRSNRQHADQRCHANACRDVAVLLSTQRWSGNGAVEGVAATASDGDDDQ